MKVSVMHVEILVMPGNHQAEEAPEPNNESLNCHKIGKDPWF